MRRRGRMLVLAMTCGCAPCCFPQVDLPAPAPAPAPPLPPARAAAAGLYRIAGTIVSNVDNHPLQRAVVEILTDNDRRLLLSGFSDEYGHFEFTGVAAGSFVLQGRAPGYLATNYDEHEGFSTAIVTGAGVDTESLTLRLRPAAELSGTILDESSDPVSRASVHLFRQG